MFFKRKPYRVKLRGHSRVIYSEGSKVMNLFYEMTSGDEIVMHRNELQRWSPPDDRFVISEEEQARIQTNISEELMRSKIPVEWA
ncbi:hypothetical protein Enr17x_01110 [Gimesia fumaroli]|uniref:Uncharacterized protein n=1 Tax=Gimesia fumaroli TaxID=2527976 RepID=A0A518I4S0_9PLAN|nr:hypothetical protein Enr17x_01110 [Gimesia fumaroli]